MALDRFAYGSNEIMDLISGFADVVKIGWGLPFLVEEKILQNRLQMFKEREIKVSNGGTLLEISFSKGKLKQALDRLVAIGFDTLELSEGVIDLPMHVKKEVADFAHSHNLRFHVEVGRKNPKNQLSLNETIRRVEDSWGILEPDAVIIEGRESGRNVGIFDENGGIKWDWVESLSSLEKSNGLMFEAPQEMQQTELIIRKGSDINLGNVSITSLAALESQREGLRGDTFGVTSSTKEIEGGPAVKFVHFLITSYGTVDQSKLMAVSGLNRRTIQESIKKLIQQKLIKESSSMTDLRKRTYSV